MSKIEWTDKTWNPVTGCAKTSPGCANCYAERMSKRLAGRCGYTEIDPFKVTLHLNRLNQPSLWKKTSRVFVCSMGDLFHEDVEFSTIQLIWAEMAIVNRHTYQVLTKRPERVLEYLEWQRKRREQGLMTVEFGLRNLWFGVSAENKEQADKRIPILLQIPAEVRFVSCEPLLSEIHLNRYLKWPLCKCWNPNEGGNSDQYGKYQWQKQSFVAAGGWTGLDWVIAGGESGPGARPMHPDWVRSLRDQCYAAEVPFLFKQWGEYAPCIPANGSNPMITSHQCVGVRNHSAVTMNDGLVMERVGKKKAGRLLDGQSWGEYPKGGAPSD